MPFNSIFAWIIKKRIHQIDLFRKYPIEVQQECLQKLLFTASQTEWGREHAYMEINSYAQFSRRVPLQDYNSLEHHVQRMMKGEQNILWPTETKWFAKSSGTADQRSKFIPVTKESLEDCHYKGGKDLLSLYYHHLPNRKLYNGKHLIVGGSAQVNQIAADSYFGDLSAIIVKNLPWWAELRRTPSKETALLSEWEEKIERMARETIEEDVYILAGVPSWTMVLAKRVLEISGKDNLKEVWPNLELFMHGGVSFEPYRSHFQKLIPDPEMHYVETYNASEGFFGIEDVFGSKDLLLMLDYGIFYEFIPMDHFEGVQSSNFVDLSGVEIDVDYAIVISTNGGLWRYILGDTIRFTSTDPYRFRIVGRTKSYINAFGEELMVDNAEKAIGFACERTDAVIKDYTVAPKWMNSIDSGAHEWFVEFISCPDDLTRFKSILDEKLRELNSDYDAKRFKDFVLSHPVIHVLPKGSFDAWLKSQGRLGGQNKILRLSNHRDYVDQLLRYLENSKIEMK